MKDIYGNEVKNLRNAHIVSSKEAKRLYEHQLKEDKIRVRHNLTPVIKYENI
jgi:hypothetical protein